MKLQTDPRLPQDQQQLVLRLTQLIRDIGNQVNNTVEGKIASNHAAQAFATFAASGMNYQGDLIWNSTPTEIGTAGGKYVVHGWRCVASGSPGTWVQIRALTGN